jgi:hypothetical protein
MWAEQLDVAHGRESCVPQGLATLVVYLDNDLKLVAEWSPNLVLVCLGASRRIQHLGPLITKHKLETNPFKTRLSCTQHIKQQTGGRGQQQ